MLILLSPNWLLPTHWNGCIRNLAGFGNADTKASEEDVPQVEAQLVLDVIEDVRPTIIFVHAPLRAINT